MRRLRRIALHGYLDAATTRQSIQANIEMDIHRFCVQNASVNLGQRLKLQDLLIGGVLENCLHEQYTWLLIYLGLRVERVRMNPPRLASLAKAWIAVTCCDFVFRRSVAVACSLHVIPVLFRCSRNENS